MSTNQAAPGAVGRAEGQRTNTFNANYTRMAAAPSMDWAADFDRLYQAAGTSRLDSYRRFLSEAPGPKSGHGNTWLFSAALRAKGAGVAPEQAQDDLGAAMAHKPHCEVTRAVRRAYALGSEYRPPAPRVPPVAKPAVSQFWREATTRWPEHADPVEALWESSPVRIDWPPEDDAAHVLRALYNTDEYLFIGTRYQPGIVGDTLRTAGEWLAHFEAGRTSGPHWIPNPLSGQPGPTADGEGETLRGDSNVAAWRFVVCEFDGISHAAQAALFLTARLPLAAVVDSGGESLHGWLRADVADAATWEREIERDLFPRLLEPLGADRACKNDARLSRTPGHLRADTGNRQRLLYLNPNAGRAAA